jgi:hypothetical protein
MVQCPVLPIVWLRGTPSWGHIGVTSCSLKQIEAQPPPVFRLNCSEVNLSIPHDFHLQPRLRKSWQKRGSQSDGFQTLGIFLDCHLLSFSEFLLYFLSPHPSVLWGFIISKLPIDHPYFVWLFYSPKYVPFLKLFFFSLDPANFHLLREAAVPR